LADGAEYLPSTVRRVTISRDLPFAQKRFADQLTDTNGLYFLSDYAEASFGYATGLLIDQIHLLARAVIVVDRQGIVRYLQVVPSITHLPDLRKGMNIAAKLSEEKVEH
jgi:thiol peroxidase